MGFKDAKVKITKKETVTLKHYEFQCPYCGEEYNDKTYAKLDYHTYCIECDNDFHVKCE